MVKRASIGVLLLLCTTFSPFQSAIAIDTARLQIPLPIPYTSRAIVLDGQTYEWRNALHLHFSDTLQQARTPHEYPFSWEYPDNYTELLPRPRSRNEVEVLLCWDLDYLYLAFKVSDAHLFAEIVGHGENPDIYMNDGIEVYIDTGFDSKDKMDINDYQFIIDILNNSIVFRGDKNQMQLSYDKAVPKDYGQNILFNSAVSIYGAVNDTTVPATGYEIEIAIPFAAIGVVPEAGKRFKMDLCVNDVDYFLHEAPLYEGKPMIAWSFNWVGLSNFGFPAYWQTVELAGSPGWFDRMAYQSRTKWFKLLANAFFVTILLYAFLYARLLRKTRIPKSGELSPAALLIIKGSLQEDSKANPNSIVLRKATDFVVQKPDEMLNSEMLAAQLGMSLRKLQRITNTELNCTPTSFIQMIKLNQAADYLKSRKGNVSETAYDFGFSDPSHFSRLFKKHFGLSPAEFIRKASGEK